MILLNILIFIIFLIIFLVFFKIKLRLSIFIITPIYLITAILINYYVIKAFNTTLDDAKVITKEEIEKWGDPAPKDSTSNIKEK
ncbi:hypothetical protein ACFL2K_00720 [Candidatus Margulisiibacteriota bacterium]